VVPSQEQISQQNLEPFAKEQFAYDLQNDCYLCPQGHKPPYSHFDQEKNMGVYSNVVPANILVFVRHQKTAGA
jgi:hypothetical protein